MIRVDVTYAFIYNEDKKKILMVNNKGGGWSLPGGAMEQGENLEQAVIREVKEETSLTIEAGEIIAVNEAIFKDKGHHAIFITFNAKVIEGEISIIDKDEISEIEWVSIQRANELMPYHLNGVDRIFKAASPLLSSRVITELKEHRRNQEGQKKAAGEMYQDQDLVVCTENGAVQDPGNLLRVTNRIIKQAGVSTIRFHDLRHSHASILLSGGVDLVKVAARMGHTSPKTTLEIYAHLVPNNDYDVADVFEMALKNSVTDL